MILKQQEDSLVDYHQLTVEKKTTNRKQLKTLWEQDSDFKFYSWDFKENYIYITYLKNFNHIFDSAETRKRVKVFSHISKLIKTRNPYQIKSHHQKMMLRHKTVDAIINYLKIKILNFLKTSPKGAEDIEIINQQCEAFFVEQASFVNQRNKRNKEGKCTTQLSNKYIKNIIIKTQPKQEGFSKIDFNDIEIANRQISGRMIKTEVTEKTIKLIGN